MPARSSSSSPAPDGVSVDHRHVGDPIDDALARLADPLVTELTDGHPERIKVCASDTCDWIFYDTSRTSRRRWCDMATCGNRAKAARHRARQGELRSQARRRRTPTDADARPTDESPVRRGPTRRQTPARSAAGTWASTDWIAWTAPSSADDSAGIDDLRVRAERELAQRVELEDRDQRRVRVLRR